MSPKRLLAVGAALALVAAAALFFLLRDRTPPELLEPPAEAAFTVGEVRALDALDREEAVSRAHESSVQVVELLNQMYTLAFLRPERWEATPSPDEAGTGAAEALSGFFTEEARASVAANLGALALDDLGARLARVDPTRQEVARLSFLIEDDLSVSFAVVNLEFQGEAIAGQRDEGPVEIAHTATYWLAFQGDSYRIIAYQVELRADTVVTTASFGVPS